MPFTHLRSTPWRSATTPQPLSSSRRSKSRSRTKKSSSKPKWDTTIHDLTQYKLSPEQLLKKKVSTMSKYNLLAHADLKRQFGDQLVTKSNPDGNVIIGLKSPAGPARRLTYSSPYENPGSARSMRSSSLKRTSRSRERNHTPMRYQDISSTTRSKKISTHSIRQRHRPHSASPMIRSNVSRTYSPDKHVARQLTFNSPKSSLVTQSAEFSTPLQKNRHVRFSQTNIKHSFEMDHTSWNTPKDPESELGHMDQTSLNTPKDPESLLRPLKTQPDKCLDSIWKALAARKARNQGVVPGSILMFDSPWRAKDMTNNQNEMVNKQHNWNKETEESSQFPTTNTEYGSVSFSEMEEKENYATDPLNRSMPTDHEKPVAIGAKIVVSGELAAVLSPDFKQNLIRHRRQNHSTPNLSSEKYTSHTVDNDTMDRHGTVKQPRANNQTIDSVRTPNTKETAIKERNETTIKEQQQQQDKTTTVKDQQQNKDTSQRVGSLSNEFKNASVSRNHKNQQEVGGFEWDDPQLVSAIRRLEAGFAAFANGEEVRSVLTQACAVDATNDTGKNADATNDTPSMALVDINTEADRDTDTDTEALEAAVASEAEQQHKTETSILSTIDTSTSSGLVCELQDQLARERAEKAALAIQLELLKFPRKELNHADTEQTFLPLQSQISSALTCEASTSTLAMPTSTWTTCTRVTPTSTLAMPTSTWTTCTRVTPTSTLAMPTSTWTTCTRVTPTSTLAMPTCTWTTCTRVTPTSTLAMPTSTWTTCTRVTPTSTLAMPTSAWATSTSTTAPNLPPMFCVPSGAAIDDASSELSIHDWPTTSRRQSFMSQSTDRLYSTAPGTLLEDSQSNYTVDHSGQYKLNQVEQKQMEHIATESNSWKQVSHTNVTSQVSRMMMMTNNISSTDQDIYNSTDNDKSSSSSVMVPSIKSDRESTYNPYNYIQSDRNDRSFGASHALYGSASIQSENSFVSNLMNISNQNSTSNGSLSISNNHLNDIYTKKANHTTDYEPEPIIEPIPQPVVIPEPRPMVAPHTQPLTSHTLKDTVPFYRPLQHTDANPCFVEMPRSCTLHATVPSTNEITESIPSRMEINMRTAAVQHERNPKEMSSEQADARFHRLRNRIAALRQSQSKPSQ